MISIRREDVGFGTVGTGFNPFERARDLRLELRKAVEGASLRVDLENNEANRMALREAMDKLSAFEAKFGFPL